jgi:hypothetical protein
METDSGGEQADGGEQGREGEQAGPEVNERATGAILSADPLPKDYLVNDAIGKALQAHFKSLTDAPLPDRFLTLLAELEARDARDDR